MSFARSGLALLLAASATLMVSSSRADVSEMPSTMQGVFRARSGDARACLSVTPHVVVFESREPDGEGGERGCFARLEVRRVARGRIELREGERAAVLQVTPSQLRFGDSRPLCAHAGAERFVFSRASRQPSGRCFVD
ncbi:MAG: hypothetical protein EVA89_02130 [Sandaracinaceae bacterium]|nr:MAG: hypothetical protein EVA89_02130 [Sandaracinaceae bacterium]